MTDFEQRLAATRANAPLPNPTEIEGEEMTRLLPLLLTLPAMADPTLTIDGRCYVQHTTIDRPAWTCFRSFQDAGNAPVTLAEAAAQCADGGVLVIRRAQETLSWMPTDCPDVTPPKPPHTLKWSAPTTNADGSELDDLAGFRIYCNGQEWDIGDPAATTWPLDDSLQGPISCDVAAMDTSGNVGNKGNQAKGER